MAHSNRNRGNFAHKTFRIAPETQARIKGYAETTGWSEARVVNAMLSASLEILQGGNDAGKNLRDMIAAAEELELARLKSEKMLAPLRKKAAAARKALAPLVQAIRKAKPAKARKAA